MKKYLGSKIGFGISILSILMLCLFVGFGIFLLSMLSMSYETPLVIMIVFVFFGTSVFFSYLIHSRKQLYSWGCFEDNRIVVSTLF